MDRNIRVISCPDFVRVDAAGTLDAAATRACLREIVEACVSTGVRRALLDVRDITEAPTPSQLFWIADELPDLGFSRLERVAIVYTDRGQGRAAFFATTARNRGFKVREFTEFEEAFNWLCSAEPGGGGGGG
jgi:hypothetical protein